MKTITITMNINPDELSNIRNVFTTLQGSDAMNDALAEAIEGVLTLTDTIKNACDDVEETPELDDSKCPVCGGDDIQGGHVVIDFNGAYQECTCSCGAYWNNLYTFKGSSEIREG